MSQESSPRVSKILTDEPPILTSPTTATALSSDSDIKTAGISAQNVSDLSQATSQKSDEVVTVGTPSRVEKEVISSIKEKSDSPFDDGSASEEENVEIALSEEKGEKDSVKIDIKSEDEGEDTPTLPLNKEKSKQITDSKKKPPMYLFPITRLKLAWTRSSSVIDFTLKAIAIIFSTLGWFCCVGGVPLMSLAMLIIGSIYIDDCNIQPNIPVYLVVSGVFGTLQHFIAVWTKYVPKDSQGRLKTYRAYCKCVDYVLHLFLFIWFILGCIWVYGVHSEVEFRDEYKKEYCHKTLYYFAFWVLNLSFILLSLLILGTFCCILCIVISPNSDEKVTLQ